MDTTVVLPESPLLPDLSLPLTLYRSGYPNRGYVEVIPGVWLGCFHTALDDAFLRQARIGTVINMTRERHPVPYRLPEIEYTRYGMSDDNIDDMDQLAMYVRLFNGAASKIDAKRTAEPEKGVLVHCYAGINRSATAIACYLMRYHGLTYEQASNLLIRLNTTHRRQSCLTNKDFRSILRDHIIAPHLTLT